MLRYSIQFSILLIPSIQIIGEDISLQSTSILALYLVPELIHLLLEIGIVLLTLITSNIRYSFVQICL